MDGATIQAKIYAGRGKAALRMGRDCSVYRPLTATAPLGNLAATIKAAFNSGDSNYKAPNLPGDALWFADLDGRITQPGDYLIRVFDGDTFYIANQQELLPIVVVECNRQLKITREVPVTAVGAVGYSGMQPAQETDVLGTTGALWPCSILLGGRSQAALNLPADVRQSGWRIMLPPSVPISIKSGDIATDDLGRRYAIEAAEQMDFGWRINAQEVHT
jgi:hypothetical protein